MDDDQGKCVSDLLHGYTTYDSAVDVVSSFQMIFTISQSRLPSTVRHFERFPSLPVDDGSPLTPDFSVVFKDGHGLVGEVSRLALHPGSADSAAAQLLRYDRLAALPVDGHGSLEDVSSIDVVWIVPFEVGGGASKRILQGRLADEDHDYSPSVAPCIVQYGFDGGKYVFQRITHRLNGAPRDFDRDDGLGNWFEEYGDFRARPERIRGIRTRSPFMNDPCDRLYLATFLWSRHFADMVQGSQRPARLEFHEVEVARELRERYGGVTQADVHHAFQLLGRAGLAEHLPSGDWLVGWDELRMRGVSDEHEIIATRACKGSRSGPLSRLASVREDGPNQLALDI